MFQTPEESIEEICSVISILFENDLNNTSDNKLNEIISRTYEESFRELQDRISGTDLADKLLIKSNIRINQAINDMHNNFSYLNNRYDRDNPYYLFSEFDNEAKIIDHILQQGAADSSLPYIKRNYLNTKFEGKKYHIKGSPGSGKTRMLAEYADHILAENESVSQVIIPRSDLNSRIDAEPLFHERLSGDILLIWDDIHDIDSSTNNRVFKYIVERIDNIIEDGELWVLAASRADKSHHLPDSDLPNGKFWSDFKTVNIHPLSLSEIAQFLHVILNHRGFNISPESEIEICYRIHTINPSPLYIISVVTEIQSIKTISTLEYIMAKPLKEFDAWKEQYRTLRKEEKSEGIISVLLSMKFLKKAGVPYYKHLINGFYTEVFKQRQTGFERDLQILLDRHWIRSSNSEDFWKNTVYTIHDVRIEAIDDSLRPYIREISKFLLNSLPHYLPSDETWIEDHLNEEFATWMFNEYSISDISIKHYEKSKLSNVNDPILRYNYGNVLKEIGDSKKAEEEYSSALELDPTFAAAYINYAVLIEDSRPEEARSYYEKALEITPKTSELYYNYAKHLYDIVGETKKAIQYYKLAIWKDPQNADAHHNYAQILHTIGELREAEEEIQTALGIKESPESHHMYALILEDLRPEDATHQYRKAIQSGTSNAEVYCDYADHLRKRKLGDPETYYKKALSLDESSIPTYNGYGLWLSARDKYEQSKKVFEKGLCVDSDSFILNLNLANVFYGGNETKKAEEHYQRALVTSSQKSLEEDRKRENATAHRLYSRLLLKNNKPEDAKTHIKKAIEIDPESLYPDLDFEESVCELYITAIESLSSDTLEMDISYLLFKSVWERYSDPRYSSSLDRVIAPAGVGYLACSRFKQNISIDENEIIKDIEKMKENLILPARGIFEVLKSESKEEKIIDNWNNDFSYEEEWLAFQSLVEKIVEFERE